MRRYLVKIRKELGEVAIDVALLNAINRLDNGCHLEVLAMQPSHAILTEMPCIDRLHIRPHGLLADHWMQAKLLAQAWDAVLITSRAQPFQLFYKLARSPFKRARRGLGDIRDRSEILAKLSLLDGLLEGWDKDVDPIIRFNSTRIDRVMSRCKIDRGVRILSLSPGASGPEKTWDKDKFVGLIKSIKDSFEKVFVVGSDSEREICMHVASNTNAKSLAGELELLDLCALLSQSTLHIGNDSGLVHVANGSGAKTCVAIGNYDYGFAYMPWKQHMLPGMTEDITVSQALEYLTENDCLA